MADPILKAHGANAVGTITKEVDGRFRARLVVRNSKKGTQQTTGPKYFSSEQLANDWILRQAASHGFGHDEFDVLLEEEH